MGIIVFWLVVLAVVVGGVIASLVARRRRDQVAAMLTAPGASGALHDASVDLTRRVGGISDSASNITGV
jgi:hypothetical protein